MDIKLHYKDPSWQAACWDVVDARNDAVVLVSGLSAPEAMRQSNAINARNRRHGIDQKTTVRFNGYPSNPSDQFGREEEE